MSKAIQLTSTKMNSDSLYIIDCVEEISRTHANNIAIIEEETNSSFTYYEIMSKVYNIEQVLIKHVTYPTEIIVGE
jgi:hypothetical protein